MQATSEVLTIKEPRRFAWLILSFFFAAGIVMVIQGEWGGGLLFMLISGGALLGIGPGDITTFDPVRAIILIKDRSFFRQPILTEIPFDQIVSLMVEQHRGSKGRIYGLVVLVDQAGQRIPIPPRGRVLWCENLAQQISALLSAGGREVPVVEASTRREVQEGTSGGIAWRLETLYPTMDRAMTRWFSAAAPLPDQCIVLCQVPPDLSSPSGRIMSAPKQGHGLIGAYLDPLQIDAGEMAWLQTANYIPNLESPLRTQFFVAGSSIDAAYDWLVPGVVNILVAFAEQNPPGRIMMMGNDQLTPLIVLASPSGLWILCQGVIQDPAKIEELVGVGVALVQARLERSAHPI